MGWLEGLLTGYADRHYDIEKQKREEAAQAAEREGKVFEALLNSDHTEIRDLAAAGILDLANPRKRAGGIQGWMGEMQKSPYLGMIQRAKAQGEADPAYAQSHLRENYYPFLGTRPTEGAAPATPSIPTPAGSVAPPTTSAALPSTSPVTGGQMTPATPPPRLSQGMMGPGQPGLAQGIFAGDQAAAPAAPAASTPPPAPGSQFGYPPGSPSAAAAAADPRFAVSPGAASPTAPPPPAGLAAGVFAAGQPPPAGPPIALPTPPPTPPSVGTGLPGGATGTVGQVAAAPRRRTQMPGIFPTAADVQRNQSTAVVTGKVEAYASMYQSLGFSPQEAYAKAADLVERDLTSSGGRSNTFAEGDPVEDPNSPTGWSQILYLRSDPTQQRRIPSQPPNTPAYLAAKRDAVNAVNADRLATTSERNTVMLNQQGRWNAIQSPIRAMEVNLRNMEAAYKRYKAGDRSAWESLRTSFVHVTEPNSVVMPSEFARAAGVLSLKDAIWGWIGKQAEGGAPLPDNIIDELVRQADAMWRGVATYGAQQRSAIEAVLDNPTLNIPHETVFGAEGTRYEPNFGVDQPAATTVTPAPKTGGAAPPATGGQTINSEMELGPDGKYKLRQP